MSLPSDWFVHSGDASQANSHLNRSSEEMAKIILEIARRLRLNLKSPDSKPPEAEPPLKLPPAENLVLYPAAIQAADHRLALEGKSNEAEPIPFIEAELIPDRPLALPSIQHRPEQVAAQTVEQMVDALGDKGGIYQAEAYRMSRDTQRSSIELALGSAQMQVEETLYRVCDLDDNEIFTFRDAGPSKGYEIITNELGEQGLKDILYARQGIEANRGLEKTMSDPTFTSQIEAMGNCAPAGSRVANFAHYALDGYDGNTIKTPRFSMSRDDQGNITVIRHPERLQTNAAGKKVIIKPAMTPGTAGAPATTDVVNNPTGQVALKTEEGRVTVFNMKTADRANFTQIFDVAKQKPIGRDSTPARPVPRTQPSR
jgi:hypothetical protein